MCSFNLLFTAKAKITLGIGSNINNAKILFKEIL
jgi:hypothetical protein